MRRVPAALVGRRPQIEALLALLAARRGALVVGGPGSGVTAVLHAVAEQSGARSVAGREAVAEVPFLPLLPLLTRHGLDAVDPLAVYAELPRRALAAGDRLVVDDAERLDPPSAVLVAQASRAGVPLLLAVRRTVDLPGPLRDVALMMTRVDLPPLTADQVEELAARVAGQRLDPPTIVALQRRAAGLPAAVLDLVGGAIARGAARETPAGLHLTALPAGAASLAAVGVDAGRLAAHRALIHRLAVAGDLPLALVDPEALDRAVADGVVTEDGARAGLASLQLADWALGELSPERRARIAGDVAEALAAAPEEVAGQAPAGLVDVLATLAGGAQAPVAAARWLGAQDRRVEALAVLDRCAPGSEARLDATEWALARSDVLADLGRVEEALEALERCAEAAAEDAVLEVVARLSELLSGRAADEDELMRRVAPLTARVGDPVLRERLESALARREIIRGDGARVVASRPVLAPVIELLRESLTGSLERARTEAAPPAAAVAGEDLSLDAHLRVLIGFLGHVYDGRLVEAREIAERQYAAAGRLASPVLGLWGYNRAKIALHAGQFERSAELGEEMVRQLSWRDPFGLLASGEALLASAWARTGRWEEARATVEAIAPDDLALPRVRLGVARVRAEELLAAGDAGAASEVLAEAGRFAAEHDEAHSGLLGTDEAFWAHPTPAGAAELEALRDLSQLGRAFATRARALIESDATTLQRVGADLEEMIQPGRAAAAYEAAARIHDAAGRGDDAARARWASARLAVQWRCVSWPPSADRMGLLSQRELDVARRAASRQRSREIAEVLGLSARTVDNHLARVFRKLRLTNRTELAEVLGLAAARAASAAVDGGVVELQ